MFGDVGRGTGFAADVVSSLESSPLDGMVIERPGGENDIDFTLALDCTSVSGICEVEDAGVLDRESISMGDRLRGR